MLFGHLQDSIVVTNHVGTSEGEEERKYLKLGRETQLLYNPSILNTKRWKQLVTI